MTVRLRQREGVVDADRARMAVEDLPEVGLAQPPVDALADLDTEDRRDDGRAPEPSGEIDLAEPALAEQPFDAVLEPRLGAGDDLPRLDQVPPVLEPGGDRPRAGRGGG